MVPYLPPFLNYLANASCLFTRSQYLLTLDYMQVLPTPGGQWLTLPEEDYFQMPPFGHRTRLAQFSRIFWRRPSAAAVARSELAAWIHARYTALHPDQPAPVAVRFVTGLYRSRRQQPMPRWRKPPFESMPPADTQVVATYVVSPDGLRVSSPGSPDTPEASPCCGG